MKQIRKRITYANVMSSIAVFLILGGATAVAAKKIGSNEIKGNSITTGKLKKNAVTASKIKNNAITTAKIKNGAVTGPKVNLSTLGKVPSATNADTAANANAVNGQTANKIFKTLTEGQANIPVATVAGFSITATCNSNDADVFIKPPTGPGTVLNAGGVASGTNETTFSYNSSKPGEANGIQVDTLSGTGNAPYGVSSVALATSTGVTLSGVIGYDYNTFGNTPPDTCIVYGHLLAG
ncbi:MAG: hypothetical protein QOF85_1186 [Solirubrobacterales bacterium]|nr:hypothetical protein [Solirubrobacterales bacterium]